MSKTSIPLTLPEISQTFKLFSLIFSYPDEEKIEQSIKLARDLGFAEIEEVLKKTDLEDLETEYTKLFISSFPSIPCPPYRSYFVEGTIYGKASVEVKELYEDSGLEYIYESEPPDHISVELEFLSIENRYDNGFLDWFCKFAECVKKNSKIYGVFAKNFERFIEKLR
jgi:nitrate reductase assembly molybdenum cofactor insertion protein NarJ